MMDIINDLIEEAKLRLLWWALCIFAISYFFTHFKCRDGDSDLSFFLEKNLDACIPLSSFGVIVQSEFEFELVKFYLKTANLESLIDTYTSKSMWMNLPMSILFVAALRILLNKVEFRWKVQPPRLQTYLSHLEKNQLPLNDERLSSSPPPPKWKKIDSPVVEAALNDFIDLILKDFVINMWYSDLTPDMEFPELIRDLIMDAISEVSVRVKEINLVDLLMRDIVDLVGDHIDLFRRNQDAIGVDVMLTLSSEERDERLKFHLLNSKELHPALISPESEYKVLQRLTSGLLATVLRKREVQCPVIRCIARELLTCLILQPIMNLASPAYINELIESLLLVLNDDGINWMGVCEHSANTTHNHGHSGTGGGHDNQTSSADWAQMLEAATQRRTEVLMPENLENMWARGRNYRRKQHKSTKTGSQDPSVKCPAIDAIPEGMCAMHYVGSDPHLNVVGTNRSESSPDPDKELCSEVDHHVDEGKDIRDIPSKKFKDLKRSNSASLLGNQPLLKVCSPRSEVHNPESEKHGEGYRGKSGSEMVMRRDGHFLPKLRCRVMGAYFEKLGSTSFAVYSIAVTDGLEKTWFVRRRYRNFERLHRHLKDIPNYLLHLPPKRIFSSSIDDAFVYQRCIQFDKYLQDLLSIANIAEQHEVWDFLSVSSKNYSFGKSSSMMRTLAVNVDDAVDDIVRQFKGVSDGLIRKVVGSSSPTTEVSSTSTNQNMSWSMDEMDKSVPRQTTAESVLSSDNEEGEKEVNFGHENIDKEAEDNESNSDNEFSLKEDSQLLTNHGNECTNLDLDRKHDVAMEAKVGKDVSATTFNPIPDNMEDPVGVPPEVCSQLDLIFFLFCISHLLIEIFGLRLLIDACLSYAFAAYSLWGHAYMWTPPNVTVPILNLVDNVFQLKKRGWLRRQVFWISKQILQVVMEDAIDDWILSEIHWLRREDTIAQGIRWVQDILWPGGTFFLRIQTPQVFIGGSAYDQKPLPSISESGGSKMTKSQSGSFELQLEAIRRASDLKKLLFDGAPAALVGLIGQKQYKRCASDIYYFTQSSICVKQLAYAILELLLISIFPELRSVVISVHENNLYRMSNTSIRFLKKPEPPLSNNHGNLTTLIELRFLFFVVAIKYRTAHGERGRCLGKSNPIVVGVDGIMEAHWDPVPL
ncbi:uncharacterized protein HKW66_Vig0251990 [Vigna angularis]|uniref:PX domain-containing protein n=1 Tax=Phaseolus angularis TaxID=3914 RepID=A0A8T0JRK2_PHAAN|nr:uncharacterized protein HKW66_Vig0251990 [Vigna angularis]